MDTRPLRISPEAWAKISDKAQEGKKKGKYPRSLKDVVDELVKHIDKIK